MGKKKKISTSALSKKLNSTLKELFAKFERKKWIVEVCKDMTITELGKEKAAELVRVRLSTRNYQ